MTDKQKPLMDAPKKDTKTKIRDIRNAMETLDTAIQACITRNPDDTHREGFIRIQNHMDTLLDHLESELKSIENYERLMDAHNH